MTFVAFLLVCGGIAILIHRAFVLGYDAGYDERSREVTLPSHTMKRVDTAVRWRNERDADWYSFIPAERAE